jgi:hypothetical protein
VIAARGRSASIRSVSLSKGGRVAAAGVRVHAPRRGQEPVDRGAATGATCASDVEALTRAQEIFGPGGGASDTTFGRVLGEFGSCLDGEGLPGRRLARSLARSRARAWDLIVAGNDGLLPPHVVDLRRCIRLLATARRVASDPRRPRMVADRRAPGLGPDPIEGHPPAPARSADRDRRAHRPARPYPARRLLQLLNAATAASVAVDLLTQARDSGRPTCTPAPTRSGADQTGR